jgi:prevent-host-death family protein
MRNMNIPVTRLKSRLADYLTEVKAGESLVVTDRGLPVAVIRPIVWSGDDEPLRELGL